MFFTALAKRKLLTTDSFVEILPNMNIIIYDPLNDDLPVKLTIKKLIVLNYSSRIIFYLN